jgi:hypothetical protein
MKLTQHIAGFLFSEGKLSFPGFGTLILTKEEAKRNPVKNKIFGPKYHCIFNYDKYDEQNSSKFILYHSRKNQIGRQESEDEFKKLSMDLLQQIAEKNKAILEGLGTFIKTDDGITFSFLTGIKELLEMSHQDYPLLVFKRKEIPEMPVLIKDEEEKKSEIQADATPPKEEISPALIKERKKKKRSMTGIIISSAAALAFLCFLICILNVFDVQKTSEEIAVSKIDEIYPEQLSPFDDDDIFDYDDPNEETKLTESEEAISRKRIELSPTLHEITKNGNLNTLIENSNELRNAFGNNTNIVVCGSFSQRPNALAMLSMIRKNNYRAFAEEYDGFIRIGILSDMSIRTEHEMLIEIQNKIEAKSWIMLPPQD